MKKEISIILMSLLCNCLLGQKVNNAIAFKPYLRFDAYPEFSYNYMNRYSTDYLKMKGISWGIDLKYIISTQNQVKYAIGTGYLKYRFNKLTKANSNFGNSNSRIIQYVSRNQPDLIYTTNKYGYNVIPVSLSVAKTFKINNELNFLGEIEIDNYFTFSQEYHINETSENYIVTDKSLFGHSFLFTFGIEKIFHSSSLAPVISFPIYTIWEKDDVFAENETENRSKWFNGFLIGIQYNFSIRKTTHEKN